MSKNPKHKYKSFYGIIIILIFWASPNLLLFITELVQLNFSNALYQLFFCLVSVFILSLPILIFPLNIKRYLYALTPLSALVVPVLFICFIYRKLPTTAMLYVLFETNVSEATEFTKALWLWTGIALTIPLVYIIMVKKLISNTTTLNTKQKFTYLLFGSFILLISSQLSISNYAKPFPLNRIHASMHNTPLQTAKRIIKAYKLYTNDQSNFSLADDNSLLLQNKNTNDRQIILLIIGESSRYKNWSINGYKRNTSPYIDTTTNLLTFNNIISPTFSTSKAVPIITTTATAQNLYTEKHTDVLSLFKAANYSSYWLSTQSNRGGVLINKLTEKADSITHLNNNKVLDDTLLISLNKIINTDTNSLFIVLHSLGSHYPYYNRYPEEFALFQPSLNKGFINITPLKKQEATINTYDNSILYTDYFISQCIQSVNRSNHSSIVLYASDHGENLYDDSHIGFGRGFGELSPQLFHIPLFIWASNTYTLNNQTLWKHLSKNISKKGSTENIIHTLCNMAGLKWESLDSSMALSSEYYSEKERFILNKHTTDNYDNLFISK